MWTVVNKYNIVKELGGDIMSKVSGLFQDLTTIKEARNGRLASWDQRGKNQDYWEIPAKESKHWERLKAPAVSRISG